MRVAGFGFRKGAGVDSLLAALEMTGGGDDVTHLATVDAKAGTACMTELGERLGLPVQGVSEAHLVAADVATLSEQSYDAYGTGCVSEAAALIAAGQGARLVVTRQVSDDRMATCAIAESKKAGEP